MLKRFESSPYAFAQTCQRMASSHDAFLELLDSGKVATGGALADWMATDSDDVDSYLDEYAGLVDDADEYNIDRLRRHVSRDRDLLRSFARTARTVTRSTDPTLAELVDQLAAIAEEAKETGIGAGGHPEPPQGAGLQLLRGHGRLDRRVPPREDRNRPPTCGLPGTYRVPVGLDRSSGQENGGVGVRSQDRRRTRGLRHEDLYDLVVTTDVLAEGVNLQQAGHIINYDLPWNPMRLVQRHGRIDRIGSFHSQIVIRCVFPDARLDDLLNLEERLHRKIKQASAAVGVGEILPEQSRRKTSTSPRPEKRSNGSAAKTQPCSNGAEPAAVPSPERNTAKNSAKQ